MEKNMKSFVVWLGNKYRYLDKILPHLPPGDRLIEPFVGGGSVFLNTDYPYYVLNDINPDLIELYKYVKNDPTYFIEQYKILIGGDMYDKDMYYEARDKFNKMDFGITRSVLFMYLHLHGFNHMCRYNSNGEFNVPWGERKDAYLRVEQIYSTSDKLQNALLMCDDYERIILSAEPGDIVYCDPPYYELSKSASFTKYAEKDFDITDQKRLAEIAEDVSLEGVTIIISNRATDETLALYNKAQINIYDPIKGFIQSNGYSKTEKAQDLLAIYKGK
jgi:DNA adenine methylase